MRSLLESVKYLLLLGIFLIDLSLPLGIAAGTPYALVVMTNLRSPYLRGTVVISVAGIVLTILGYHLSPEPVSSQLAVITNRALAIIMISATAIIVMSMQRDRYTIEQLGVLSTTDVLTQAKNRLAFDEMLETELSRAQRYHRNLSLALIDIDHFKQINDQNGHDVGDQVLTHIAEHIKGITRASDEMFRLGGDEFAFIFIETDLQKAEFICEKIRRSLAKTGVPPEGKPVTVSIGVTSVRQGDTRETLFKRADIALYESKNRGRNCVTVKTSEEAAA